MKTKNPNPTQARIAAFPPRIVVDLSHLHCATRYGVVSPGERGYQPLYVNERLTLEAIEAIVVAQDGSRPATPAEREAAVAGSMFGWDCPAADPALYEKPKPKMPAIGDRVRLRRDVGDYPISPVKKGSLGTVTTIDNDGESDPYVGVTMDRLHEDLSEWQNELHVYSFSDVPLAEAFDEACEVLAGREKLDSMCDELDGWCDRNLVEKRSADELYHAALDNPFATPAQRDWLKDFCERWDAASEEA